MSPVNRLHLAAAMLILRIQQHSHTSFTLKLGIHGTNHKGTKSSTNKSQSGSLTPFCPDPKPHVKRPDRLRTYYQHLCLFCPVVQKLKKVQEHLLSSFHRPGLGCARSWWTTTCSLADMFDSFITFTHRHSSLSLPLSLSHTLGVACMDRLLVKAESLNQAAVTSQPRFLEFPYGSNAWKLLDPEAASCDVMGN
jgi:hypothetical protein